MNTTPLGQDFVAGINERIGRTTERVITRPHRCITRTQHTQSEIRSEISTMNFFLLCNEMMLCGESQRYSYRILNYLRENGMCRHEMKKYANQLKEVTDGLKKRCDGHDREITLEQCNVLTKRGSYAQDFYNDGGSILNRMTVAFSRMYEMKIKVLRLDNKEIAKSQGMKHSELIADLLTLLLLAQTGIDLFDAIRVKKENIARGVGRFTEFKSLHNEKIKNAINGILDKLGYHEIGETPEVTRARKHLFEFHRELSSNEQFELFDSSFLALKMDYIEYYLARLRIDMIKKQVGLSQIRDIWDRLGSKEAVREFFQEMKAIRIPMGEDTDAIDISKTLMSSDKNQLVINSFRRLLATDDFIRPCPEDEQAWQYRILRTAARKNGGELSDEDLALVVEAHGTKKAVMEQLSGAGPELAATLRRVRKMKIGELKKLTKLNKAKYLP